MTYSLEDDNLHCLYYGKTSQSSFCLFERKKINNAPTKLTTSMYCYRPRNKKITGTKVAAIHCRVLTRLRLGDCSLMALPC